MANEVIIAFKTKGLEQAKALAKDIAQKVKEAAKSIKDIDVRKKYRAAQKQIAGERADDIAAQERSLNLEKRGAALKGRDVIGIQRQRLNARVSAGFGRLQAGLGLANDIAEFGDADPTGARGLRATLNAAGAVGGPIVGAIAQVAQQILAVIEKKELERIARENARFEARMTELLARVDLTRRLESDREFRQRVVQDEFGVLLAKEARLAARPYRRHGEFGLD